MTALRAFEAVARHGSLTGAAQELCVTPAAVSHRLKDLEALSTAPLLRRENGVFRTTVHGSFVLDQIGDAFQRIRDAHEVLSRPASRPLEVVVAYSFAVMWLLPSLSEFQTRFPHIRISIHPSHTPIAHTRASTSLSIVHADGRPDGTRWEKLFDDVCAIVAAADHPVLRASGGSWAARLRDYPLIHISHERGAVRGELSWRDWAALKGATGISFPVALHVTAEHAAVDVALTNGSLTLVSLINSDRVLRAGRAGFVPGSEVLSGKSYWMRVNDSSRAGQANVREFTEWLRAKAEATTRDYSALTA